MVLMTVAIGYSLVAIYKSKNDVLYLPVCESPPYKFYDFYYRLKENLKGDDQSLGEKTSSRFSQIYHLHRLRCESKKCRLSQFQSNGQNKPLETIISEIIESKKGKTIENRIFY